MLSCFAVGKDALAAFVKVNGDSPHSRSSPRRTSLASWNF